MHTVVKLSVLTLAVAAVVGLVAVRSSQGDDPQRTNARGARLGVFESRAIAVAFAHSKLFTEPKAITEEHKKAEAAGDKRKAEELRKRGERLQARLHHQGFGKAPVDDLLAHIKTSLPDVCKETGVDAIVTGVVHATPGVESVDVTDALVQRFDPSEKVLKIVAELRKHPALSDEEISAAEKH